MRQTKRTADQLKKPYYYTAYYYCSNCNKLYHDDRFKVTNPESIPLHFGSFKVDQNGHDIEIWTDGACVYNGTPKAKAAWAFVSGKIEHAGRVEGKQTNNVAEGLAIYHALFWAAEKGHKRIVLYTDSQISLFNLKKAASNVKVNREIFEGIEKVIAKNNLHVDYKKVLGHSGDPNNERADALANGLVTSS
ncbi:MAG TPA: RNase H family protein [Candidatus Sulfotelmatobacter sp.]|nr:RNase H family protein [Candidatus Sulfotelmatobacter sp.]